MKASISASTAHYPYSNAKRFSILVLDDEPDVTAIIKKGLELQPEFVVHAYNEAHGALESLSQNDYDIMIVDIRMPKIDGFEFYQKAQQIKDCKVIFITASDSYHEEYQKRFPQLNGNCFILKPISISILKKFLVSEIAGTRENKEPYN